MAEGHPLLEALPPATDYLTYLTIIEYNLKPENLQTLHEILQDTTLTINIGWDLVHLLVPLLPASEVCLQDIARLGNPREVILKVTESLRLIDYEGLEPDSDEEMVMAGVDQTTAKHPAKTAPVENQATSDSANTTQAIEAPAPLPLPVLQFTTLLSMLSILHPRIKTQYPSRFLSTSLQAILASFSNSVSHKDVLVSATVKFVKTFAGTKRPHLPPRKSSTQLLSTPSATFAPDPEADAAASGPSNSETAMQQRLLQSFVTHVLEEYMLSLTSAEDVPGLAWCSRLQEKLHPERTIPNKSTMTETFASNEDFHGRLTTVGELIALAQDLGLQSADLLAATTTTETALAHAESPMEESDPPKSAADVPLSKPGSLFLFCAREVSKILYGATSSSTPYQIFPNHEQVLATIIRDSSGLGAQVGSEPEAVLDALLAMALMALEANRIGEPEDDEQFNEYLQITSLISANCPSPNLRYHAYYLTTTVLRSHPSDDARLAFIRDTLEHCPFENLKVSAVSWVKGEIMEANFSVLAQHVHSHGADAPKEVSLQELHDPQSIFATPFVLDNLAPFLFPDLSHDLSSKDPTEAWLYFQQNLHFYLASLNFYYLLLSAKPLHQQLAIGDLHVNNDIAGSFMHPLRVASARFKEQAKEGGPLHSEWKESSNADAYRGELELLDATLERVTSAVVALNNV
ncbi:YAP1-binding protein 1 [Taxawa tesnikishii (nom. ined.)]|nr:YAP1-binding protein 1 [Dothideales sp. JES 119]